MCDIITFKFLATRGKRMKKLLAKIMDIGEQMLISGGEVHRVEQSVKLMCDALGSVKTDVFIITNFMVVTATASDGETFTQSRRITSLSTDYEMLHRLNSLSRRICETKMSEEEIAREYRIASENTKPPLYAECFGYSLVSGMFTLFFGGGVHEFFVSAFIGILIAIVTFLWKSRVSGRIFSKFISSALASAISFFALHICIIPDVDKVMIGNIMTLIPGVGLTNALRDIFVGDSIAGLLRFIEAALAAVAIALGYFLVSFVGRGGI